MMTPTQQRAAARHFAERWKGKGYEKGESQKYWTELLQEVLGVANATHHIVFEEQVKTDDHTNFIDAHIPATRVIIEQKSLGKSLTQSIRQSDGTMLTPFEQARRYINSLPVSQHPRWIVTSNFAEIYIYDMEKPNAELQIVRLEDMERDYPRLQFLVERGNTDTGREFEISMKAGAMIGEIYDALLAEYRDPSAAETLRSLNILCTRLVFCFYAEDADVFSRKQFQRYLEPIPVAKLRSALIDLFRVLDTPIAERDPYLEPELKAFPYVNGGLFSEQGIEIPLLTLRIKELIVGKACPFDWSPISPTIFGAVFESTLNPTTRRSGGMHYTSIENIHRVIGPLFLDALEDEFSLINSEPNFKTKTKKLEAFREKIAALTFFDPACGSGNFLTETYLSLRRLENRALRLITQGQMTMGEFCNPVKVSIANFYGIEVNDFAATVAKSALWIAESQMLRETADIVSHDIDFLPLKTNAGIHEGNALTIPWETVIEPSRLDYIMGNPPFVGARLMSAEQKSDVLATFGAKWKNVGSLDYVACWYKKAADYMHAANRPVRAALVSTNSIVQGESVAALWQPLFADGVHIDFAHTTFRWDSEATLKAHVHCVIVGFSTAPNRSPRYIYNNGEPTEAQNINAYLLDAPDVFVASRTKPICDVPPLLTGSQRIDNDNFIFDDNSKRDFLLKEPQAEKFFRLWYGAVEFLHSKPRWCLYLANCTPAELAKLPHCKRIVQKVREYRLTSSRSATIKAADYPTKFGLEVIPTTNYMIVPVVTSERREYIPIGFMRPDVLCSNQVNLIPNATLYHFGVLTSSVHMAWMRAVCGRLKSDYRYSKDIVYNNFPWATLTERQTAEIAATAQEVLDARALYPDSTLADLYDTALMPPELRRAHRRNDRAVCAAYGFSPETPEPEIVAALMRRYQSLT